MAMRYVIIRCEDTAGGGEQPATLLEGARLSHLGELAQAGAAGVIRPRRSAGRALDLDRMRLHQALCGLGSEEALSGPGSWYAAHANVALAEGQTAWCCELLTQRDGRVVDPSAGNITDKEGELLIRALDERLGSERRRWAMGEGSHHVLIAQDPALAEDGTKRICSPEQLLGRSWNAMLPKGPRGEALSRLIEEACALLEPHAVNRVRIDLGENPANLVWLWGPSAAVAPPRSFTERRRLSGAVVSSHFPMQGFSRTFGLDWSAGPRSFDEQPLQELTQRLAALLDRRDVVYVHLRIETADAVQRLCAMERLDRLVVAPLTEALPRRGPWRLLVAVDDRRRAAVSVVAIGTGLPRQPLASLTGEGCAHSPLAFEDGSDASAWFMR